MARRLLNFLDGLLNLITMLVIVVVGAYAGYALWDNEQIYASVDNVQEELIVFKQMMENNEAEIEDMFKELRQINPDVCAWLTMHGTKIDYPVVYGETNQTYLYHNVYKEFSISGSIFLDCRCDPKFEIAYSLVHGHHMVDSKMFGDLDLYKDGEFFWKNRTGKLYLQDRIYDLRTFAALVVTSTDDVIFAPYDHKEDNEKVLRYAQTNSLIKDDEMIDRLLKENELAGTGGRMPQVISLATCSGEFTDARTVVLAEMIPVEDKGEEQ